jgi:tRNA-binding EMAP/Myf-like protein
MKNKFWKIEGYDNTLKIYEGEFNFNFFKGKRIEYLLQALAAKGLNFGEIVGAYAIPSSEIANNLLSLQIDARKGSYTICCGESLHFVARIIYKDKEE